jgi:hypothetical protein
MASTINWSASVPSDTVYVDLELKNFKTIIQMNNNSCMNTIFNLLQPAFVKFESGAKVSHERLTFMKR